MLVLRQQGKAGATDFLALLGVLAGGAKNTSKTQASKLQESPLNEVIGSEVNRRRFRALVLLAGSVGGLVIAGTYVLASYSADSSHSDVFVPEWVVLIVLSLFAGVFGLLGAVVALAMRRWMLHVGLAAWAQTVGIVVSTFVVGMLGYLAFAGWWGPGYGFFVAGAVVTVPVSIAAVTGMILFPFEVPAPPERQGGTKQ
jgi:MFS family permease